MMRIIDTTHGYYRLEGSANRKINEVLNIRHGSLSPNLIEREYDDPCRGECRILIAGKVVYDD